MLDLWLPPKPAIIIPAPEIKKPVNFSPANLPGTYFTPPTEVAFTISVFSVTSATTAAGIAGTIVIPGSVIAGDVLFVYNRANGAAVTPGGFTNLYNINQTVRMLCHYKVAVLADAGATITGMTAAAATSRFILIVIRGTKPITSVSFGTINAQATTGNPTSQSNTASGQTNPVFIQAIMSVDLTALVTPSFSPAQDAIFSQDPGNAVFELYYKTYNTSPQDTTVDMGDGGTIFNHLSSFYAVMNP